MEIINHLQEIITNLITQMPYFWIFIFMTMESTLIPLPSEIVMIPAGYFAALWKLNIYLAMISGIAGNILGAVLFYLVGKYWGQKLVYKILWKKNDNIPTTIIKKIKHIFQKKSWKLYDLWDIFFQKHWEIGIFFSRMLPVVRHIISFPAWVFNMDMKKFIIYTGLWSGIWIIILTYFWRFFGMNTDLMHKYKLYFVIWILLFIALIVWIKILIVKKLEKK